MREDWIECTLGELLSVSSGKGLTSKKMDGGIYPVYGGNGITGYHSQKIFSEQKLIIGRVGVRCGVTHITQEKSWVTDNALVVNFKSSEFDLKFMKLKLEFENLNKLSNSTAQPVISGTKIYSHTISLPPLVEQKAIVKKIEALFSSLDSGIADLTKAQDQLKIYRQAVLSSCFPKNGKIEISELIENLSQGWSPKCINQNSTDSNQWAVIKTSAIQAGKFVEFENKILPDTLEPRDQHEIKKGDILITRAGPRVRVGICCLVKKTRPKLINCDKVYRIELNQKLVTPEYFEYALNSPEILSEIEIMKSGSNDSGLNLTQTRFLKLEIPICSKEEQYQIVQEIESRLSVCDKVEKDLAESLEKAQALRQSILKKAFEGTLLSASEIAACKAHPDYEPASVLLEKIKAEKKK